MLSLTHANIYYAHLVAAALCAGFKICSNFTATKATSFYTHWIEFLEIVSFCYEYILVNFVKLICNNKNLMHCNIGLVSSVT